MSHDFVLFLTAQPGHPPNQKGRCYCPPPSPDILNFRGAEERASVGANPEMSSRHGGESWCGCEAGDDHDEGANHGDDHALHHFLPAMTTTTTVTTSSTSASTSPVAASSSALCFPMVTR
jgi:hypothetical protein